MSTRTTSKFARRETTCVRVPEALRMLEENLDAILLLVAVLVACFISYKISHVYETKAAAWPKWAQHSVLAGAALAGALAFAGLATAHSYLRLQDTHRWVLLGLFVLAAVLIVWSTWDYFLIAQTGDHSPRWLMLVALGALLAHAYCCYLAMPHHVLFCLPAIALAGFLLVQYWN